MDIGESIIDWYKNNKRDLPWRNSNDPYVIWVSEIIMQQTRINQGIPYFNRFIKNFPTVFDLAQANEEEVLLAWQGLGYYSRARNMHYTASEIAKNMNGKFPKTAKQLIKLKGIGAYTAAAISSFCYNENVPAIDGNVIRVISRLFNITEPVTKRSTEKQIIELSLELVKGKNAYDFNQGMMDLGATVCTPKNPLCEKCPLLNICRAKEKNMHNLLPIKEKAAPAKNRYLTYLVIKTPTQTLITKRNNNDIWKGLFEFPLFETIEPLNLRKLPEHPIISKIKSSSKIVFSNIVAPVHKLSHQNIYANFFIININKLPQINNLQIVEINELHLFAFPRLIEKHLSKIFY